MSDQAMQTAAKPITLPSMRAPSTTIAKANDTSRDDSETIVPLAALPARMT
jgi:hypothetical protein